MRQSRNFLIVLLLVVIAACQQSSPVASDRDSLTMWEDSLLTESEHLYNINDNFLVIADSLNLEADSLERKALLGRIDTTAVVVKGDLLVIADYVIHQQDSIDSVWVKVARDQNTIGWVRETELLSSTVPDDPISQFIHYFSSFNKVFFLFVSVLAVLVYFYRMSKRKEVAFVHFNDIDSPYPALLSIAVSGAAVFYGTIQHYAPELWVHFYFYPTLNPFILPFSLACFIVCVWAVILLLVAVVDEVLRKLPFAEALSYLVGLACLCMLAYIFFSISTPYYIGYPFFVLYVLFVLYRYFSSRSFHCGACGAELPQADCICPRCGARNVR